MSRLKHCRLFKWRLGDCGMLTCSRCGRDAYKRLEGRIVSAARRQQELLFITLYYDPRRVRDLSELPLFQDHRKELERQFRQILSRVFRSLRDKARRIGVDFQYVIVLAVGKPKHKIHKVLHSHALVTWLPDVRQHPQSKRPERLECPFLDKRLKREHLIAWVEKPRSNQAVARYTAKNAKTVIGKKDYAGMRVYRISQGFEK